MTPTELYWWVKLYWRQDGPSLKQLCRADIFPYGRICWPAADPQEQQLAAKLRVTQAG